MARNFNGSTDIISTTLQVQNFWKGAANNSDVTSFAFSCWAYHISPGGGNFPLLFGSHAALTVLFGVSFTAHIGLNLYLNGNQTTNDTAFTTNTWHHCGARLVVTGTSTGFQDVFVDGTKLGSIIVPPSAPGTVTTAMGIGDPGAGGNSNWFGYISDFAVWSSAWSTFPVTDSEMVALASGARPWQIEPKNLVHYEPLWGLSSPEPDLSGFVRNGTLTGTTLAPTDAPVMQFTPRWPQLVITGAAAGAVNFRRTRSDIGTRVGSRQRAGE